MCEGITDKRFAECLKQLLTTRTSGFTVRIDEAGGGGPKSAIMTAINHAGGFDKRVVYIDSDIPIPREALSAARNHKIQIIQSIPFCLEGLLLRLMGYNNGLVHSQDAKDTFLRMNNLENVVTQAWYEQNITLPLITAVLNNPVHPSQALMKELSDVFTVF